MKLTPDELELVNEWERVRSAFVASKERRSSDPETYAAAKAEMSAMRTYWRQVGEAVGTRTPVAPLSVKGG